MQNYLAKIIKGENLSEAEAGEIAQKMLSGELNEIEIAAFLVALATKGESEDEIVGMVRVLREKMIKVEDFADSLDTCGTGGDCSRTINVSTISAFVCAAAGVKVAKHGNRSISSDCGSFDVLEALGAKINLSPEQAKICLEQAGIACLFAPNFHPAFKYVMPVRKALGVRTIFNFLGPLLNPAGATHQLIGVSSHEMAEKLGKILIRLGSKKVILVHSQDGLDEISTAASTNIDEFNQNQAIKSYNINPDKVFALNEVRGGGAKANAEIMRKILAGFGSEAQNEIIILNAGMALYAAEAVSDFEAGKDRAREILKNKSGLKKLEEFIEASNSF